MDEGTEGRARRKASAGEKLSTSDPETRGRRDRAASTPMSWLGWHWTYGLPGIPLVPR
jgi:hypothetical protein